MFVQALHEADHGATRRDQSQSKRPRAEPRRVTLRRAVVPPPEVVEEREDDRRDRAEHVPASNDSVAKPSPCTHEARGLSCGHAEGIEAVRHRDDAIDATSS